MKATPYFLCSLCGTNPPAFFEAKDLRIDNNQPVCKYCYERLGSPDDPDFETLPEFVPGNPLPTIKPCPFCGGKALVSPLSNEYCDEHSVSCTGELDGSCAGLEGTPFYDTEEDAIKAWNTRAKIK